MVQEIRYKTIPKITCKGASRLYFFIFGKGGICDHWFRRLIVDKLTSLSDICFNGKEGGKLDIGI